MPEYDNVLLSHDDRNRFVRPEHKGDAAAAFAAMTGSVLHDGIVRGAWRLDRDKASGAVTLTVRPLGVLDAGAEEAVAAEGGRLVAFLASGARATDMRVVR